MQIQDDIVKKILRDNEKLKGFYYDKLDTFTEGHVEYADLSVKLRSLCHSVINLITNNTISPQSLIDILDIIEEYVVNLEDQNDKEQLEIMFFEDILNSLEDIKMNEPNYRYVGLFKDNLGPASEELCEKNHQFWRDLIQKNREKYNH